jgi:hypothetical protein
MDGKEFVVEITMGVLTVFFPTESSWRKTAPDWAIDQWQRVRGDLIEWCAQKDIPLIIEDRAWVFFTG